jgi:putative Mg2+ transporter-C (MgtC) family protein
MTTAADIWLTAAIGVAAGLGRGATALLTTVLANVSGWLASVRILQQKPLEALRNE